jgi:hypothetical protein
VDTATVIPFPRPSRAGASASPPVGGTPGAFDEGVDVAEIDAPALAEIDAAIALVAARVARRVRLVALPIVESVAALGLAHARAAGIEFACERGERIGVATLTIGPLT